MTENFQRSVVLYHVDCSWEMDYVFRELLVEKMPHARVLFMNSHQLVRYREKHASEKRIVVFSSSTVKVEQMKMMLEAFDAHVVFHFSDEFGDRHAFCELATLTKVFFHQHRFESYPRYPNMVHIPLGFKTGFVYPSKEGKSPTPSTTRELTWSFIGTLKQQSNRQRMLDTFKNRLSQYPSFAQTDGGVSTRMMGEIYAKSVFVPSDRGDVVLDCFRLYEAMLAGAIPVVVGAQKELRQTFLFDGEDDFPPFLVANTWNEAAQRCIELLQDNKQEELLEMQQKNIQWIQRHLQQIRTQVQQACQ